MSHLTVPGAMTSIRSITGRLVLISLSCRKQRGGVKHKCSLVFTQIQQALSDTCTHLEAADLRVLAFLAQGGVDPVEDDQISNLLSITQIRQNPHCVPEGWQAK